MKGTVNNERGMYGVLHEIKTRLARGMRETWTIQLKGHTQNFGYQ